MRSFPLPHTAENTSVVVKDVLLQFGVPVGHCVFAVTDNCSVMEKCVRDFFGGSTLRFHCVAHWLQLVIHDALKASGVNEPVAHVRGYVKKVVRRDKWWQALAKHQAEQYPGRDPLKLFLDGGVRWSALYLMAERVSKVELAILKHLGEILVEQTQQQPAQAAGTAPEAESDEEDGPVVLMTKDLQVVRQMVPLLRPLYDATNVFQTDVDKSPISVILPKVIELLHHLKPGPLQVEAAKLRWGPDRKPQVVKEAVVIQEAELADEVKKLRAELLLAVQSRFGSGSALDVKGLIAFYYAATFLDPRKCQLPTMQYASPMTCASTRTFMIDTAAKWMEWEEGRRLTRAQEQQQQQQAAGAAVPAAGGNELTPEELEHLAHAALVAGGTVGAGMLGGAGAGAGPEVRRLSLADHRLLAERELDRWMQHKLDSSDKRRPPLQWWAQAHVRVRYPYLSAMARRILSIPASSAGAERVFSQSGLTLGELRQKMGQGTLENLMVLKYHHCDGHIYLTPSEWAKLELVAEGGGGGNCWG